MASRRSSGVVGATSGTSATPAASRGGGELVRLLQRQVGDDQAADPARGEVARRSARRPGRRRGWRSTCTTTGHELGEVAHDVEDAGRGGAGGQRLGAGVVDDRAVGERVGVRDADLQQVRAVLHAGGADRARGVDVREAAHQVRHQRRLVAVRGRDRGERPARGCAVRRRHCASTSARSLSPRPLRQTRSSSDVGRVVLQDPGERVGGLERRDDALELGACGWKAASAAASVTAS